MSDVYQSKVPGYEGPCKPTWINKNQVCNYLDGGVTGFFKLVTRFPHIPVWVKTGKEFHGIIRESGIVESTELTDDKTL